LDRLRARGRAEPGNAEVAWVSVALARAASEGFGLFIIILCGGGVITLSVGACPSRRFTKHLFVLAFSRFKKLVVCVIGW
jgi:hypothetical protein